MANGQPHWTLSDTLPQVPGARCKNHPEPLWDDHVDGESPKQRHERHHQARMMCGRCPVTDACHKAWEQVGGSGIWAGQLHAEGQEIQQSRDPGRIRLDTWRVLAVLNGDMAADDLSRTERAEVVRQLAEQGQDDEHIAEVLGASRQQVRCIRATRGIGQKQEVAA